MASMDSFPTQFTSETADIACSKWDHLKRVDYISWYTNKIMELNNAIIAIEKEVK